MNTAGHPSQTAMLTTTTVTTVTAAVTITTTNTIITIAMTAAAATTMTTTTKAGKGGKNMFKFNHFNYNILDLEKSMKFYEDALGLKEVRRKEAEDGSWKLVYLGDGKSDFTLELTWLRDRKDPYNLGENEFHLAFVTEDYDAAYAKHKEMGCICFENPDFGIYFINDPDNYWIEIIPAK